MNGMFVLKYDGCLYHRPAEWVLAPPPFEWLLKVSTSGNRKGAEHNKSILFETCELFLNEGALDALRRFIAGEFKFADMDKKKAETVDEEQPSPPDLLQCLLKRILSTTDFVCTTPNASRANLYKERIGAKVVALDEAGAMNKADVLTVWGPTCRS
ncbi:uncharacterized protein JN550_006959 [Neoarthrinium moseri]|uniref:uncharacterized protein n=1 Tax=Neoarthrinium moseri TaxID=1658444 RepID=UPI001FDD3721|nr:uncharacterized protein JN550_006959 [Neoarthrinium moseri]KAI1867818.1 hypothetical protein JN550_006959 [Neoarthrinium moseri]